MLFNTWIVGDAFLRELWWTFTSQKTRVAADKASLPFLFENFNVTKNFPAVGFNTKSIIAWIHNEGIKTFNEEDTLPKYIIVILGLNLIEASKHGGPGGKFILKWMLQWLIKNINLAITTRKEDINAKKVGTLFPMDTFPKVLWLKAIQCPIIKDSPKGFIFSQSGKFNDAMQALTAKQHNNITIEVNLSKDRDMFDLNGNLSQNGKSRFWRELNRVIRIFDKSLHSADTPAAEKQTSSHRLSLAKPTHRSSSDFERLSVERAFHQFKCY